MEGENYPVKQQEKGNIAEYVVEVVEVVEVLRRESNEVENVNTRRIVTESVGD